MNSQFYCEFRQLWWKKLITLVKDRIEFDKIFDERNTSKKEIQIHTSPLTLIGPISRSWCQVDIADWHRHMFHLQYISKVMAILRVRSLRHCYNIRMSFGKLFERRKQLKKLNKKDTIWNQKAFQKLLYVLIRSPTCFRVNSHSIAAWMSRNSLLETGKISDV